MSLNYISKFKICSNRSNKDCISKVMYSGVTLINMLCDCTKGIKLRMLSYGQEQKMVLANVMH